MKPFDLKLSGSAYIELVQEWEASQDLLGPVCNVFIISSVFYTVFASILVYYFHDEWRLVAVYMSSTGVIVTPSFFLVFALEAANMSTNFVEHEVRSLLGSADSGLDVMKLATLTAENKCSLRLLGREITHGDLVTGLVAVLSIQALCLLGLGWLVNP